MGLTRKQKWLDAGAEYLAAMENAKITYAIMRTETFDGYECFFCNEPAMTFVHILPKSKGGNDDIDNLIEACHSCSAKKQGYTLSEWVNRPKTTATMRKNINRLIERMEK